MLAVLVLAYFDDFIHVDAPGCFLRGISKN
jgi:hypothetical protein